MQSITKGENVFVKVIQPLLTETGTIPVGTILWLRRAGLLSEKGTQWASTHVIEWNGGLFVCHDDLTPGPHSAGTHFQEVSQEEAERQRLAELCA